MTLANRKSIGLIGANCVSLNTREVLALGISMLLILPYCQNKHGDLFNN